MTPCPHCGAVRERFGRFTLEGDPPAVFIDGKRVEAGRIRENILALLVRHGRVSYEDLAAVSRPGNESRPARVHISYLRRLLPPGFAIENIQTYGYQLTRRAPASPEPTQPRLASDTRP